MSGRNRSYRSSRARGRSPPTVTGRRGGTTDPSMVGRVGKTLKIFSKFHPLPPFPEGTEGRGQSAAPLGQSFTPSAQLGDRGEETNDRARGQTLETRHPRRGVAATTDRRTRRRRRRRPVTIPRPGDSSRRASDGSPRGDATTTRDDDGPTTDPRAPPNSSRRASDRSPRVDNPPRPAAYAEGLRTTDRRPTATARPGSVPPVTRSESAAAVAADERTTGSV